MTEPSDPIKLGCHHPILTQLLQETLTEAMKYNDQLRPYVNGIADDLNPLRVQVSGLSAGGGGHCASCRLVVKTCHRHLVCMPSKHKASTLVFSCLSCCLSTSRMRTAMCLTWSVLRPFSAPHLPRLVTHMRPPAVASDVHLGGSS
jgi:hypothetical protein